MSKDKKRVYTIVEDMKKYASGNYFIWDGELYPVDRDEFCKKDGCTIRKEKVFNEIHIFYIIPDGEQIAFEDLEIATIGDFFDDFYDVFFVVDSDKKYKACRVLVACGVPNIYIDTWEQEVQLTWWSDTAIADIPYELCAAIDEFFEIVYEC